MKKLIQTLLASNMGMGSQSYTFRLLTLDEDKNFNPSKDIGVKNMYVDFAKDLRDVNRTPQIVMNHYSLPFEDRNWDHIVVLLFVYEKPTRKEKTSIKKDLENIKKKYYERYTIKQKRRLIFWN